LSKTRKKYLELIDKGYDPERAMRIALGKEEEKGTMREAFEKKKPRKGKKK
jgi:hypothetical protein